MVCGKECEVYSRVVGYFRPVQNWNAGKQEEFKDRQEYAVEKSLGSAHGSSETPVSDRMKASISAEAKKC